MIKLFKTLCFLLLFFNLQNNYTYSIQTTATLNSKSDIANNLNVFICSKKASIDYLNFEIEQKEITYGESIRFNYKNKHNGGYINLLLNSKNRNDFFFRIKLISTIEKNNKKSYEEIILLKAKLQDEKNDLKNAEIKLAYLKI